MDYSPPRVLRRDRYPNGNWTEAMDIAPEPCRLAVIGAGRMGSALTASLRGTGIEVLGPLGRELDPGLLSSRADAVLLCVPDSQIAALAARVARGPLVGHCSGATGLTAIGPHEAFSWHPAMTLTGAPGAIGSPFAGAGCVVAGNSERALRFARRLAGALEMRAIEIDDDDRAAHHAATAIASNFLLTLEDAAERLAITAGADRRLLVPLVRETVNNWARLGAVNALTGPIARGDEQTVVRQRDAVRERTPDLLALFDALTDATRAMAGRAAGRDAARPRAEDRPSADAGPACVRTVADLRSAVTRWRRNGETIGLVPTMGALHEGHLSLIRRARAECDQVVVSIFVNPTQFAPGEDLASYPRDLDSDAQSATAAGATLLFAPAEEEMYPRGHSTIVSVAGLEQTLCASTRGTGHFSGVATVVTKLLSMVGPQVAYFGQKDAQQAVLIRRLVRDLHLPVAIAVCPIVREPDGLAMSSRNAYLSPDERQRATALHRGLLAAERATSAGERCAPALLRLVRQTMVESGVKPEYVELVDPHTLKPVRELERPALLAVAATIGSARLIDNAILARDPASLPDGPSHPPRPAQRADAVHHGRPRGAPRVPTPTTGGRRSDIGADQPCSA